VLSQKKKRLGELLDVRRIPVDGGERTSSGYVFAVRQWIAALGPAGECPIACVPQLIRSLVRET